MLQNLISKNALLLVGSSIMLIAGTAAVIVASQSYTEDSALWFIGFVLISLSGLSMTAAVFKALGYPPSGEAFGLPSGSIRALLAISIMVLLLIFALPLTSWSHAPLVLNARPLDVAIADCGDIKAELARYGQLHLVAVVDSKACVTPPVAGAKARISLYASSRQGMSHEQIDLSKQVLTAVITLLTTVIGFYFGSQNTLTLAKAIKEGGTAPAPVTPVNPVAPDKPKDGAADTPSPDAVPDEDPDNLADSCPSDAEPLEGEAQTADADLPASEGGVASPPASTPAPTPPPAAAV
jgi:hypothetical protein